jgi:hypothetical protein
VNTQGGYRGFSFPIGKRGIRYKVGGARGHSVEIGTKSRSKTQAYSRNEQARCLHGLSEDCGHAVLEVGESDGVLGWHRLSRVESRERNALHYRGRNRCRRRRRERRGAASVGACGPLPLAQHSDE